MTAPVLTLPVASLMLRPEKGERVTLLLPLVAFAVTTALVLSVLAGTVMFWRWPGELSNTYRFLSTIALVLLIIPLASLASASARLSARRRDERLATLKLLGARTSTVVALTALESVSIALAGALVGVILSLLLTFPLGLIHFGGEAIGANALLLHPLAVAACVLLIVLIAAVSSLVGLRQLTISPLGVRTRQHAPTPRWVRVLVAVLMLGLSYLVLNSLTVFQSFAGVIVMVAGGFALGIGLLGVIGPWLIALVARIQASRAKTAARLIAARTVLDSPSGAWRQVGSLATVTFVAVIAGVGLSLVSAMDDSETLDTRERFLVNDMRTGVILTLLISFFMVACSVAIQQSAAVLDRRDLYRNLEAVGMPRSVMEEARARTVRGPLATVVLTSAATALLLVVPMAGFALVLAPLSVALNVGVFVAGYLLVLLAQLATRPIMSGVLS